MDTAHTFKSSFKWLSLLFLFGFQTAYTQCTILRILETDPSCGLDNGSITVVMDGLLPPYLYSIDNGISWQTTNIFDDLPAGDYIIRVVDGLGCVSIESPQLADSGFPEIDAQIDACLNGTTNSTIILNLAGRDPFTFNWENTSTGFTSMDQDPGLLEPGTYNVTITDGGGCVIDTFFIAEECCSLTPQCDLNNREISCLLDLPTIQAEFLDNSTTGKEDQDLIETLGIQLIGLGACNDVVVSARDSIGEGTGCVGDEIEIVRFYTLSDQITVEQCLQVFTLVDREAPNIFLPAEDLNLTCENTNNLNQQFDDWISAHANALADDCNIITWTTIPPNPTINLDCNTQGITKIIFIAEDECGNSSSTEAEFVVTDNSDPIINCPSDLVLECSDPNNQTLIDAWLNEITSSDACSNTTMNNDLNMSNIQAVCGNEYMINFEARDECGKMATCMSRISYVDTQIPILTCPTDLVIQIGDVTGDTQIQDWLNAVSGMDNCTNALNINNDFDPNGVNALCGPLTTQEVTFDVIDDCGNVNSCTARISLEGTVTSSINCPTPLELECNDPNNDQIIQSWLSTVTAFDSDGSVVNINNDFNFLVAHDCSTVLDINFNGNDLCGGNLQCAAQISFIDTNLPTITCPSTLFLVAQDDNNITLIEDWINLATAQDACTQAALSTDFDPNQIDPICGVGGTFPITFTAQDACGNQIDCMASIEIEYDASMTLNCPTPLVLQCGADGNAGLVQNWLTGAGATANVTGDVFAVDNDFQSVDGMQCGDQLMITFNSINECGERFECTSMIEMQDNEAPVISCVQNLIVNVEDLDISVFQEWLDASFATDNCGPAPLTNDFDPSMIDASCNETVAVNFTTRDACDNESTCATFYTIVDNRAPKLSCPGDLDLSCTDDVNFIIDEHLATISHLDNSGDSELFIDIDNSIIDDIDCSQTYEYEFDVYATDKCDNEATCIIRIKVRPELFVYTPDIFSPNGDGINDKFTLYGNEYASIIRTLQIYDRWGNLVFAEEDLPFGDEAYGWDGRFNNIKTQTGVFAYFAVIENGDSELKEIKGNVTVIN